MIVSPFVINILGVLVGALIYTYWYIRQVFSFWSRRGVPFKKPHKIFGNIGNFIKAKRSLHETVFDYYKEFKGNGFGGCWVFYQPLFVVTDQNLIRDVLIKNFDVWSSRGFTFNRKVDPLSANMINFVGEEWKSVRAKSTTSFTTAKLKSMQFLGNECAMNLKELLESAAESRIPVEVTELAVDFVGNVIGSCAFGVDINSLGDRRDAFRILGQKSFRVTRWSSLLFIFQRSCPRLFKFLNLAVFDKETTEIFTRFAKEVVDMRKRLNIQTNDYLDKLRNSEKIDGSFVENENELTSESLAALFVWFSAGVSTTTSLICFSLRELAANQDIQDRLREEIRGQKLTDEGEITWDGLQNMKYLDMIFHETLRMYPPVPTIDRVSVKPYEIPDTNVILPAGIECAIPIYGIHHDPSFYPDPEKFDPSRFTQEAVRQRPAHAYLPFGGGPRNCIGIRFVKLQAKLAIITVIDNYKISLSDRSRGPLKIHPRPKVLDAEGGTWLCIEKLTSVPNDL